MHAKESREKKRDRSRVTKREKEEGNQEEKKKFFLKVYLGNIFIVCLPRKEKELFPKKRKRRLYVCARVCVCVDNTTSMEKQERNATVSSSSIFERRRKALTEIHTHTDKQVNIDIY